MKYAAIAEKFSEHPLSKAIIAKAIEMNLKIPDPTTSKLFQDKAWTPTLEISIS